MTSLSRWPIWSGCIRLLITFAVGCMWIPLPAQAQQPAECDCPQPPWLWAHGAHLHQRMSWNMEAYSQRSTAIVVQGLAVQAQNGEAVEMTVWNHHFEERDNGDGTTTTILLPSGRALLHRAARRYSQRPDMMILVQTARDQEFKPDEIETYAYDIDHQDAKRVAAVKTYLAKVLHRPDARVLVHDPAVVGMPSEEMTLAYLNMIHYGPRGVLLIKNNDITAAAEGERDTEREPAARSGAGGPGVAGEGPSAAGSTAKGASKSGAKGKGSK